GASTVPSSWWPPRRVVEATRSYPALTGVDSALAVNPSGPAQASLALQPVRLADPPKADLCPRGFDGPVSLAVSRVAPQNDPPRLLLRFELDHRLLRSLLVPEPLTWASA